MTRLQEVLSQLDLDAVEVVSDRPAIEANLEQLMGVQGNNDIAIGTTHSVECGEVCECEFCSCGGSCSCS